MKQLSKSLITLLLFAANTCAYAGQNMRTKDSLMVVTESNDNACTSHLVRDKSGVWDTLISIYCADGSEIEPLESMESTDKQTQIEVFAIYNAAADGSQYVLYNHKNHKAYITFATFADLTPTKTPTKNTLNTGNKEEYIANASKFRLIKARLKPIKTK